MRVRARAVGPLAVASGSGPVTDVVGIGEEMVLLVPEGAPLERATTLSMRVAGAEGNVLIGLSRLGHRTALLSAVGADPFGTAVLRTLRDEGVDTSAVVRDPNARTGVFFKDPTPSAERRVFYYRDGSAASRLGRDALAALDRLAPRVLVVSGLTLGLGGPEGLAGLAAEAIRRCHARGITTVFDANLRPGLWEGDAARADFEALRGHLDVLLAGREELAHLVPGRSGEDVAAELCRQGCAGVVVKDGPRGAVAVDGEGAVHVPAVDRRHRRRSGRRRVTPSRPASSRDGCAAGRWSAVPASARCSPRASSPPTATGRRCPPAARPTGSCRRRDDDRDDPGGRGPALRRLPLRATAPRCSRSSTTTSTCASWARRGCAARPRPSGSSRSPPGC